MTIHDWSPWLNVAESRHCQHLVAGGVSGWITSEWAPVLGLMIAILFGWSTSHGIDGYFDWSIFDNWSVVSMVYLCQIMVIYRLTMDQFGWILKCFCCFQVLDDVAWPARIVKGALVPLSNVRTWAAQMAVVVRILLAGVEARRICTYCFICWNHHEK